MARSQREQFLHLGVDVGGTFTDLVAWDGTNLHIVKIPSTGPEFHLAVIEAVRRCRTLAGAGRFSIVHGSTVATNALLQRRGEPIAFITTEGFRDMLLIGRQNRPELYALRVKRPRPITDEENWFTVRERIDARGQVVEALTDTEIDRVIGQIRGRGLAHAAVCLLFSYINPVHEQMLGARLEAAGITASLSCDVMSEFREYERASTTAINAALRPVVQGYLESLEAGLSDLAFAAPAQAKGDAREGFDLRIMHCGGGTLRAGDAARHAARLVLSGPAGGVIGAALVARQAGLRNIISYDMGGTSTDVATVLDSSPQWTTASTIAGLAIALPMFEINTIGAGGGSIAYLDAGGALRVGPQSAGAMPGPACYGRGGSEATVTDANIVLGRIVPDHFLGGAMKLDVDAAHRALERLGKRMNKNLLETALGVIRVVEANMAHAVAAVTSRRGRDPRQFALVSFGGAGGLHVCGLAEALDIPQVVVPPYCGVLSALGMIVAPPVVDVSQTVLGMGQLTDDQTLNELMNVLRARSSSELGDEQTETIEQFADVRFRGQSHELNVGFDRPQLSEIVHRFHVAYRATYGRLPGEREIEVVSLRLRRKGRAVNLTLPSLRHDTHVQELSVNLTDDAGLSRPCSALTRAGLLEMPPLCGPALILDPEATTYIPCGWAATVRSDGTIFLSRSE